MIKPGTRQNLIIVNRKPHGVYLGESPDADAVSRVLLPARQVPEGAALGDRIEVFIYRDSDDRLIATTDEPLIALEGTAVLRVSAVTKIGAFLDWGLPKELLLPFQEQTAKVRAGEDVLVAFYIDRSDRCAATMKVYPYLSTDAPYIPGQTVTGRVYQMDGIHGAYVAVDDRYSGRIPARELTKDLHVGDVLSLHVTAVKEDGKLDLSVRDKAYLMMDEDAEAILQVIRDDFGGELPFDDKADPEKIREVFGLSKASFKRAVGRLYKERRIELAGGKITLCQ